ncbi:MAG TPA: hypothetical protein PLF11_13480 [Bacillota bacterium]|nr:hypothetical protein [Bacillota bacterium]
MATGNRICAAARRPLSPYLLALAVAAALSCAFAGTAGASSPAPQASASASASAPAPAPALASALAGSGTLSLELKAQLEADPELKAGASYRIGQVSSSLQYRSGRALELKVSAGLDENWRQFRHLGSLTLAGSIDSGDPKASWSQMSMSAGGRADRKAISWQPESKLELSVRSYPNNPVRDYAEVMLTAKAGKTLPGEAKPSVKGELSLGHKEMPGQPKWTADFWNSTLSLQWRPVRSVQAAASLSAKGRAYPEASHKSYTTYGGKAGATWTASKQHSLEFTASAQSTVRPGDHSKDRKTADASAKWTMKTPAASIAPHLAGSLTLTARATAGATLRPNLPDQTVAWRAGASSGLVWEVSKSLKLSVAAETAWSGTGSDDDWDDNDDQDNGGDGNDEANRLAQQLQDSEAQSARSGSGLTNATASPQGTGGIVGKITHRLTISVTAGPYSGITFSGKAIAVRTDESKQGMGIWTEGTWAPSVELKASYKF